MNRLLARLPIRTAKMTARRYSSSSSKYNMNNNKSLNNDHSEYKKGMDKLKETNPYLHKMAPTRGGTELPDAKFLAVFGVVASAGFYAWFIDPPKED